MYGSITTAQITDSLNEALGTEIDRRKVGTEPLRQLGEHKVVVRLSAEFHPHVTVMIESEDGKPYVPAEEEVIEIDVFDAEEAEDELEAAFEQEIEA